jgi:heptose I phosphotransferase
MYKFVIHNGLLINEGFIEILKDNKLDDFRTLKELEGGSLFKKNRFRSVVRIELKDKVFYLKRHFWPWKERLKSIIPWIKKEDAINEWENMVLLKSLGFNTMTPVAFGEEKFFGIPYFSLTLTENVYDAEKLEQYLPKHFSPPLDKEKIFKKRELIKKVALITRGFHSKGLNHQDFYLGHLFIKPKDEEIFIIDIQRVHYRQKIRVRDRIKDLSQLAFSAKGLGILTKADFMRFIHTYFDREKLIPSDKKIIKRILSKVKRIEKHTAKLLERRKRQK